jgi:hypothetical protein
MASDPFVVKEIGLLRMEYCLEVNIFGIWSSRSVDVDAADFLGRYAINIIGRPIKIILGPTNP